MSMYEIFILVKPEVNQDNSRLVVDRIANVITSSGNSLISVSHLGIFSLAYEIKRNNKARVFVVRAEHGSSAVNKEIARLGRISSSIIRLCTLKIGGKVVHDRITKVEKKTQKMLESGKTIIKPKVFSGHRFRSPQKSARNQ